VAPTSRINSSVRSAAAALAIFLALASFPRVDAFEPRSAGSKMPPSLSSPLTATCTSTSTQLRLSSAPPPDQSLSDLFSSEGWPPIKKELDLLPVFTVANEKGQPLQYTVGSGTALPFFFVDVDAAQAELAKAKADSQISDMEGMEKVDIIPYPLGQAFELMENDKAIIIPSQTSIEAAGAPSGVSPVGQQIPLFACMEISQQDDSGKPSLPLFFEKEEAKEAIDAALEMDGDSGEEFPIQVLSLQRAVQLLATVPESPAFTFLPPNKSLNHIKDYLQG